MYVLNVEKRDENVKAKKLRKSGFVPCNVSGTDISENLLFTIPEKEAKKLLKEKSKGALVTLKCKEEEINALIKSVSMNNTSGQIEDISFQRLTDGRKVTSVAKIIMKNKDKATVLVQLLLPEIEYKALPEHIIETIEIDLAKLRLGDQINVGDLLICDDPNVEIAIKKDRMVLNTMGSK